ncbi:hypothetical protein FJ251_08530 [bacterium]|nr:hypothetical protein [bacterium]
MWTRTSNRAATPARRGAALAITLFALCAALPAPPAGALPCATPGNNQNYTLETLAAYFATPGACMGALTGAGLTWTVNQDKKISASDVLSIACDTLSLPNQGITVHFASGRNLTIKGTLEVQGGSENHEEVVFCGLSGGWGGLRFVGENAEADMDQFEIRDASGTGLAFSGGADGSASSGPLAAGDFGINPALGISVGGASTLTIAGSGIAFPTQNGIRVAGSGTVLTLIANFVYDSGEAGLYLSGPSTCTVFGPLALLRCGRTDEGASTESRCGTYLAAGASLHLDEPSLTIDWSDAGQDARLAPIIMQPNCSLTADDPTYFEHSNSIYPGVLIYSPSGGQGARGTWGNLGVPYYCVSDYYASPNVAAGQTLTVKADVPLRLSNVNWTINGTFHLAGTADDDSVHVATSDVAGDPTWSFVAGAGSTFDADYAVFVASAADTMLTVEGGNFSLDHCEIGACAGQALQVSSDATLQEVVFFGIQFAAIRVTDATLTAEDCWVIAAGLNAVATGGVILEGDNNSTFTGCIFGLSSGQPPAWPAIITQGSAEPKFRGCLFLHNDPSLLIREQSRPDLGTPDDAGNNGFAPNGSDLAIRCESLFAEVPRILAFGNSWADDDPESQIYHYVDDSSLSEVCYDGCTTTAAGDTPLAATAPQLLQNYPNPFNPSTEIHFDLPGAEAVSLSIHDLAGRRVLTLLDRVLCPAGRNAVKWNGRDSAGRRLSSGVYFCRLEVGDAALVNRMTMLK